eukprot:CAMPEP_0185251524 /NCGR_PEP_ID=MMETSP1359-20130426/909_1 /TAXON_ID=552665 /ORGANISM="Bigelowiella longifila, Strain CCMP242" /LENGTH=51 /DNA_ID=CAMNT_0027833447 /DNA_START=140 /DNA_END=292 /DNA_ORIENTATION=+
MTDGVELAVTQRKIQRMVPNIRKDQFVVEIDYEINKGHGKANWGTYEDQMV